MGSTQIPAREIAGNHQASPDEQLLSISSIPPGGLTVTLPKTPAVGDTFTVVDPMGLSGGDAAITIDGNGEKIAGRPTMLLAGPPFTAVTLQFSGRGGWYVQALAHGAPVEGGAALSQPVFFVSPRAGSDANDGSAPGAALKSVHRIAELVGSTNVLLPPAVAPGVRPIAIVLLDDLPASDPITLSTLLGPDVFVTFQGQKTTVRSGTFTAVVLKDRAANQPYVVKDSARTVAWSEDLHARLRIVSGPRAGAIAYVCEDLGGGAAITSDWSIPNPAPRIGVTQVMPQAGDAYVVETLTKATLGPLSVKSTGNSMILPGAIVDFTDIEFQESATGVFSVTATGTTILSFHSCRMAPLPLFSAAITAVENCALLSGAHFVTGAAFVEGGVVFRETAAAGGSLGLPLQLEAEQGCYATFDADAMCYGGPRLQAGPGGGTWIIGFGAVFKATDAPSTRLAGNGVQVFAGGSQVAVTTALYGGNMLWGSGNQRRGVGVEPGSGFHYDTVPVITGLEGDFVVGARPDATQARTFDPTTNAYTGMVDATWTNLKRPVAQGGLGGTAVDPLTMCSLDPFVEPYAVTR